MTERGKKISYWERAALVLTTSAAAVKGEVACLDTATGIVTVVSAIATLIPIGYFSESATGDGSATVGIDLFQGITLHWFDNDTGTPLVGTDVGNECYLKDGRTVIMTASTRSKAGRVMAIDSAKGVLVQCGMAVTGPTGGNGQPMTSATRAAMTAIAATGRSEGVLCVVQSDGSLWRFRAASTQTVDGAGQLVLAPDAGTGRWVRATKSLTLKLPVDYTLADAAVLFTCPEQMSLRIVGPPTWEIVTGFTGGASSAIGMSASAIATTKGDLLGGAAGQLTAAIGTAGVKAGTIGPLIDTPAEVQAMFLIATNTLRFDRITSAYTAGAGFIHVPVCVLDVA